MRNTAEMAATDMRGMGETGNTEEMANTVEAAEEKEENGGSSKGGPSLALPR